MNIVLSGQRFHIWIQTSVLESSEKVSTSRQPLQLSWEVEEPFAEQRGTIV
jgi:hypothetical protein